MALLVRSRALLNRARMLPKAFAQADKGTVKRRLVAPARDRLRKFRIKAFRTGLSLTDRSIGATAGNVAFWRIRNTHVWNHVDGRLRHLQENHPGAVPHFVQQCYAHATNPEVLINLARSALTRDALRDCLAAETLDEGSSVRARMIRSQMTSAGFISAATLLLSDDQSAAFVTKVRAIGITFSPLFRRLIDSSGSPVAAQMTRDARRKLADSGFKTQKKRRLVLAQSEKNLPTLPLLFAGADEVVVYTLDDLYGRADFSDGSPHVGPCHIDVEHCRSRITRFSAAYHRVYKDTRKAAERLTDAMSDAFGDTMEMIDPQGTAMAMADHMFFPTLQFVALERLLASDEFDHIVIALAGAKGIDPRFNKRFVRLLAGVDGIGSDPRVEVVCLSPSSKSLETLDSLIKLLVSGAPGLPVLGKKRHALPPVAKSFRSSSAGIARAFGDWPDAKGARILLATSQVAAYNKSSTAYSQSLANLGNLRVAFLGGNLLSFTDAMDDSIRPDMITLLPQRPGPAFNAMHLWLVQFLTGQMDRVKPAYVAHVMAGMLPDLARNGALSYLVHCQLCEAWFRRLAQNGQLPKVAVLTPFRSIRVAAFAAVARRHNVPSIAIEPHGLTADYCRYCQITADYYGVISSFFAQAAADGFGMSLDRCPVVGSPRLQGPKDYDVAQATAAARARLKAEGQLDLTGDRPVFTYFTQPSDWNQISEVWRIILKATDGVDCLIILKTHPEESTSRVNAYLSIARELGALDRIAQMNADAISLIEASDLVLSGYSATVVEAALHRRPVFCVTNGRVNYPLSQHDVVGGPLFRSVTTLRRAIKGFLKDPAAYQAVATEFLAREPQLLDGFDAHLRELINHVVDLPVEEALRPVDEVPKTLFLNGPHTVYKV